VHGAVVHDAIGRFARKGVGMFGRWSLSEGSAFALVRSVVVVAHREPSCPFSLPSPLPPVGADSCGWRLAVRGGVGVNVCRALVCVWVCRYNTSRPGYDVASDYFLYTTYLATVGTGVLDVRAEDPSILVYAHCAAGPDVKVRGVLGRGDGDGWSVGVWWGWRWGGGGKGGGCRRQKPGMC
jgi:hypothetical protein